MHPTFSIQGLSTSVQWSCGDHSSLHRPTGHRHHPTSLQQQPCRAGHVQPLAATSVKEASNEAGHTFSLPLAAAMGCCSFEAYNAPYILHGVKELSPCKTETVYMDRDFMDTLVAGVMEVHFRRAERLPELEDGKKGHDVQAMVAIGPSAGFTAVQPGQTDPLFAETHYLYLRHPHGKEPLTIKVFHKDVAEEDHKLLCEAKFADVENLLDGEDHELEIQLVQGEDEQPAGSIFLCMRYYAHSEETDAIEGLRLRAAGQMMTDDWRPDLADNWYNDETWDWRPDSEPAQDCPTEHQPNFALDITGLPCCKGQPLDRPPWKQWTSMYDSMKTRKLCSQFEPIAFVVNTAGDRECWVYTTADHEICVSFRGTESPVDMAFDAVVDLAAFAPGNRPKTRSPEEVADDVPDKELAEGPMGGFYKFAELIEKIPLVPRLGKLMAKGTSGRSGSVQGKPPLSGWAKAQAMMIYAQEHRERWVHNGFLQAYFALRAPLMRLLEEIMEMKGPDEHWHIYATGHSMGGSLATLLAYELATRTPGPKRALSTVHDSYSLEATEQKSRPQPDLSVYTFGQPRVGNIPWAEDYDEIVPDTWRICNPDDLVTRIPSLLGYRHVGHEVRLDPEGKGVTIAKVSWDQVREGAFITDILPKIKEGILGKDKEARKQFKSLISDEWRVTRSVATGKAIKEHMEPTYFEILKVCVDNAGEDCNPPVTEWSAEAPEDRKQ